MGRSEDGRVPRSARESRLHRVAGAWQGAGLFQLSRILRAAPRPTRRLRYRSRFLGGRARAREGEREAQWAVQCRAAGDQRVRLSEGTRARAGLFRHDRAGPASLRQDACVIARGHSRLQGNQSARDAPPVARRTALHRQLQLSSHQAAVPRNARSRRRRLRATYRAARAEGPAGGPPRGADDPGDGIHQGRAVGSDGLMSTSSAVRRTLVVGLLMNALVTVIKLVSGLRTGALTVVGSALESGLDLLNNFIALTLVGVAHTEPDEEHPYGHAKFETLGTLAVVGVLSISGF